MDQEDDGLDELRALLRNGPVPIHPVQELEELLNSAISDLGIGGWVHASELVAHFNPISDEDFARIAYASDLLPTLFDNPSEAQDAKNVVMVIEENCFELKPHFNDLKRLFSSKFQGAKVVRFE